MYMLTLVPPSILLPISMLAGCLVTSVRNRFGKKFSPNVSDVQMFTLISQLFATILLLLLTTCWEVSAFTISSALLFGVVTLLGNLMSTKALQYGPMGLTSVLLYAAAMTLPAVAGIIFWNEKLTGSQSIGIVFMLLMLPFSVPKNEKENKMNYRWIVYSVVAMLSCGAMGILQKFHQTSSYREESDVFLLIAFTFSVIGAALPMCVQRKDELSLSVKFTPHHSALWLALACGLGIALPNKINLYLSGVLDSTVLFPIINGGGVILVLLVAIFAFKEKPTIKQTISIVLGTVAIVFLCGLF